PDAAVKQHGDLVADLGDDLRQHLDARGQRVELPPAVVRHDNAVRAVLDRQARVLGTHDALDDEWAVPASTQQVDVRPGLRWIEHVPHYGRETRIAAREDPAP